MVTDSNKWLQQSTLVMRLTGWFLCIGLVAMLFDYGILANLLHGLVMVPQAFFYPNEHAHMWADIPGALAICVILWWRHPNRMPD